MPRLYDALMKITLESIALYEMAAYFEVRAQLSYGIDADIH